MKKILIAASFSVLAAVSGASAQDLDPEFGIRVHQKIAADFDGDGIVDNAILMNEECDESDGACPWIILPGNGGEQIVGGFAHNISLTNYKAFDGVRNSIKADNVEWALAGNRIFPVNDSISTGRLRVGLGATAEAALISQETAFGPQDPALYQVWRGQIIDDGQPESVVVLPGGSHLVGNPWAIIGRGKIIATGWSLDWPRIFPHDNGLTVVSVSPMANIITEIR